MPFFKDMWKGVTNPDKPNKFMQQYAQALLAQGGGSKGPIARMGNKLAGGLLLSGQNRANTAQEAAGNAAMQELFTPKQGAGVLAATPGPGLLSAGGMAGMQPGQGLLGAPSMDPSAALASSPMPISDITVDAPKAVKDAVTKITGNPLDLPKYALESGRAAIKLMESGDPRAKALGESLVTQAVNMKPNEKVQFGPDGTGWIYDTNDVEGSLRQFHLGGKKKSPWKTSVQDGRVIRINDETGEWEDKGKLPAGSDGKIQTKTEKRLDKNGNLEQRTIEYIRDKENHKITWQEPTQWMPAASQQIQSLNPLAGDKPYARDLMASKIGAEDGAARALSIRTQLEDPVYGDEIFYSMTRPGEALNWWRGEKSKWGALQKGDPGWDEYQRVVGFRRDVSENANLYIKEITGAQMSEAEAQRLLLAVANLSNDPAQFQANLDGMIKSFERVQKAYDRRLMELVDQGVDIATARTSAKATALQEKRSVMDGIENPVRPGEG